MKQVHSITESPIRVGDTVAYNADDSIKPLLRGIVKAKDSDFFWIKWGRHESDYTSNIISSIKKVKNG